jgi:hypothetical protein
MDIWSNDRDPIDAAIDDVARRMTEGAPQGGFTARVLARIEGARAPWRVSLVLSPLAAAAALAVIVTLAYHWWPDREPGSSVTAGRARFTEAAPARIERPPQAQGDNLHEPPQPVAQNGEAPVRRTRVRGDRTRSITSPPTAFSELDALAPPALEIVRLDVDRIAQPDPIGIDRLETFSIELAPIGEGDRP